MKVLRTLVASPRARLILAMLTCYLVWQGWLTLRAPGKISAGVRRAGGPVDVQVTLRFPPERFHVLVFQRFGRVSGTEGIRLELRGVMPSQLTAIARPHWVARVEPMELNEGRAGR